MKLQKTHKCNWLIIVIIHDFQDKRFPPIVESIIKEFEDTGIYNNNAVLLIHDQIFEENGRFRFKAIFKELIKDPNNPGKFSFREVDDVHPDFQFHEGSSWEKSFRFIKQRYVPNKTVLTTLSDGAGVGLLDDVRPEDTLFVKDRKVFLDRHLFKPDFFDDLQVIDPALRKKFTAHGNSIIYDVQNEDPYCKTMEMLWVTEIADAIKKSYGSKKIDIFMMNNCFMQSFESGWLLRNSVDYLVASETIFRAFGYSFKGLLQRINAHPAISLAELIRTIKPDFIQKWKTPEIGEAHLKVVSSSINQLKYYGIIKLAFEKIAKRLSRCTNQELQQVFRYRLEKIKNVSDRPLNSRDDATTGGDSSTVSFIDLISFMSQLPQMISVGPLVKIYIWIFCKFAEASVKDIYIGEKYHQHDESKEKKFRIKGISIFMPTGKASAANAFITNCAYFGKRDAPFGSLKEVALQQFIEKSCWDEFIRKYVEALK